MSDGFDPATRTYWLRAPDRDTKFEDIDADNPKRELVLELAQTLRTQENMPPSLLLVEGTWRVVDFVPFLRDLLDVAEGSQVPCVKQKKLESLYRTTKTTGHVVASDRNLDALASELYEIVRVAEQQAAIELARATAHHEKLRDILGRATALKESAKGNGK